MLFNEKELQSLVAGKNRAEILGEGGILKGLIKGLIEAGHEREMEYHLGDEIHEKRPADTTNARNGSSTKKRKGDFGETEMLVPRDQIYRQCSFPTSQMRNLICLNSAKSGMANIRAYRRAGVGIGIIW